MTPLTCGLVLTPRRIVAVVLGPDGRPRRAIRAALTDDARAGFVAYLAAAGHTRPGLPPGLAIDVAEEKAAELTTAIRSGR